MKNLQNNLNKRNNALANFQTAAITKKDAKKVKGGYIIVEEIIAG